MEVDYQMGSNIKPSIVGRNYKYGDRSFDSLICHEISVTYDIRGYPIENGIEFRLENLIGPDNIQAGMGMVASVGRGSFPMFGITVPLKIDWSMAQCNSFIALGPTEPSKIPRMIELKFFAEQCSFKFDLFTEDILNLSAPGIVGIKATIRPRL